MVVFQYSSEKGRRGDRSSYRNTKRKSIYN